MLNKMSVTDLDVRGKRVLVRVDFNVPLDENLNVTDDTRIETALPTIKYLIEAGAKTILMSHLGRPKGNIVPEMSLVPAAKRLGELLRKDVPLAPDCVGEAVKAMVDRMQPGDVLMLENTRFHPGEESNDPGFARQLADLGDLYVNDAFGTCHRAHASTEGVAKLLPKAAAGLLVQKELDAFGKALSNPDRPFVAVLGGAKVSDKIPVIANLLAKVNVLIIGGGMAYTFLKAKGYEVGKSLLDQEKVGLAGDLMKRAADAGVQLLLPTDILIADRDAPDAETAIVPADQIPADKMGMDIGPEAADAFGEAVRGGRTVIWNGPMGRFEYDIFAEGTRKVAQAMADCAGTTIVGGGDSIAAIEKMGLADEMTHISTGGGASLELLEGKQLPGVVALTDNA